jgi:hypothetical protein
MSKMPEIVRHYTREIVNGRTVGSAFEHLVGEVNELGDEIANGNTGPDGIKGEVMDVVNCALDILFMTHPDIGFDEIDALMEAKCRKWMLKYAEDGTDEKELRAATDLVVAMHGEGATVPVLGKILQLDADSVGCVLDGALMSKATRERLSTVYPVIDTSFPKDPERFRPLSAFRNLVGPHGKTLGDILSADEINVGDIHRYLEP